MKEIKKSTTKGGLKSRNLCGEQNQRELKYSATFVENRKNEIKQIAPTF